MHLPLHDVYILAAVEDSETKMLRRNWVAQCKFGSGLISTDQRCLHDVCFSPVRDQISALRQVT